MAPTPVSYTCDLFYGYVMLNSKIESLKDVVNYYADLCFASKDKEEKAFLNAKLDAAVDAYIAELSASGPYGDFDGAYVPRDW